MILGRDTFFFRDFAIFSYPLASYHRECFWRGEIPLWNPYNDCGLPFLAQWNTMVLYPLSLIYLLLPLPWSLNFFCLFHLWLGGMGMYFLARSWTRSAPAGALAGFAFSVSGVVLSCLKWPNNIAALAWMPWVVLTTERAFAGSSRSLGIAALLAATQMLSGAPEIILLTWIMTGALWIYTWGTRQGRSQILRRFPVLVLLVIGLSAAQLFPFLDLLRQSQRDSAFHGSAWPMPPWGWANFLLPLFRMFPSYHGVHAQPGQYWISSYYVAIAVLLLAVVACCGVKNGKVRLLCGLFVFSIWMALGNRGLLYKWLRGSVPGLSMIRFPIKFVVLADFVLPLLGAFGLAGIMGGRQIRRRLVWIPALVLAICIGGLILFSELNPFAYSRPFLTTNNGLWRIAFLVASAGLLTRLFGRNLEPNRAMPLLCALVVADGLTHTTWENPVAPRWVFDGTAAQMQTPSALGVSRAMISKEAADTVDHLKLDNPAQDVMASRVSLYCNLNLLDHIPKVDGFYAVYPREMSQLQDHVYSGTNDVSDALLDFLGVTQVTAQGSWQKWEHRTNALPLITSVPHVRTASNGVGAVLSAPFKPREEVILDPTEATGRDYTIAQIDNVAWGPQRIAFEARTEGTAFVVLAQTFYSGWKATVDGAPARLVLANGAFQALALPAGHHAIVLQYRDFAFRCGVILSFASLLVAANLIARANKNR